MASDTASQTGLGLLRDDASRVKVSVAIDPCLVGIDTTPNKLMCKPGFSSDNSLVI